MPMGSLHLRAGLCAALLVLGVVACDKSAEAPPKREFGDGIYEAIPRGPYQVDEALATKWTRPWSSSSGRWDMWSRGVR